VKKGRRIRLNDGTVYEDSNCGSAGGVLWCYITGQNIIDVVGVFCNREATEKIIHEYGNFTDEYSGFVVPLVFQMQDSICAVCLAKEGG